jgi:sec-independent protein translocase protein TatC
MEQEGRGFLDDGGLRGLLELAERRGRLYMAIFAAGFVLGFPLAEEVIEWLLDSGGFVPDGVEVIILQPLEIILLQLRIAAQIGFALLFLALAADISSIRRGGAISGSGTGGMRSLVLVLLSSIVLACLGAVYAHNILIPFLLEYLAEDAASSGLRSTWQLQGWVGFVTGLYFSSVVGFQVPVLVVALLRAGVIDRELIVDNRGFLWFSFLFIGALISPPDPISLFLVGGPMLVLLEFALLFDGMSSRAE